MKHFIISLFLLFSSTILLNGASEDEKVKTIKIMPLGDSITFGIEEDNISYTKLGGYRSHLWYMLKDANISADFVGSQNSGQAVRPSFDTNNEGYPGWTSLELSTITYNKASIYKPDIILLHIGTNDKGTTNPDGVGQVLDKINLFQKNSAYETRVIVALIIDRQEKDGRIKIFNQRLEELLQQRIINGDRISIVDMYKDAHLDNSDYANNTHPNKKGYEKMAKVWFKALMAPYTYELYSFPSKLVNSSYIKSLSVNETTHSVTFVTEVPNSGINF